MNKFRKEYRPLADWEQAEVATIKSRADHLLNDIVCSQGDSRERRLAVTKLEECVMWAVKGITG